MTIGDVMAVVGSVLGICLSLWVLLIGLALLFEKQAGLARQSLETRPGRAFGAGFLLVATAGVLSIVLLNAPGGFKLIGWALLLVLLAFSMLGGSGLALLMGERTGALAPELSPLGALARGGGLLSLAWIFPVLGWFLIAPFSVIIGLGAGWHAVFSDRGKRRIRSREPLDTVAIAPAAIAPVVVPAVTAPVSTPLEEPCESPVATG